MHQNNHQHRTSTTSPWRGRPTTDTSPGSGGGVGSRNNYTTHTNGGVILANKQHHHLSVHQAVACAMRSHLDVVASAIPQQPSTHPITSGDNNKAATEDTAGSSSSSPSGGGAEVGVKTTTPPSVTPSTPSTTTASVTRSHQHGPFVLMCGKTFSVASGIAFHNTETLHRVEIQQDGDETSTTIDTTNPPVQQQQHSSSGLSIYKIGTHYNLYPALFCTCPSFQFQCINKPEALLCKHLLAVALRLGHGKDFGSGGGTAEVSGGGNGQANPPSTTTTIPTLAIPQDEFIDILGAFAVSERGGPFRGGR